MTEIPKTNPEQEKKEAGVDDNARKFIVGPIDKSFLEKSGVSSTKLIIDWVDRSIINDFFSRDELELIDEGDETEVKLAYKEDLNNRNIEILLIAKIIYKNGTRKKIPKHLDKEKYENFKESLEPTSPHLEKIRHEFTYTQNDVPFPVKYDEFVGSDLRMLEVEDSSEGKHFDSDNFPIELREVSDDPRYSGYRVAEVINQPDQF